MRHIARVLSLVLVLALMLAVVPGASAFTLTEKVRCEEELPVLQEAGGHAPTLNADDEYHEASPTNKTPATADEIELNSTWAGVTNSSDPQDYFLFTLEEDSDILFVSVSTYPTMIFGLFTTDGTHLATCQYIGIDDGLYMDAIAGTLEAGTYFIQVAQYDFEGGSAYAQEVVYALDFHVHDYTVSHTKVPTCTETGTDTYTCADCGYIKTVTLDKVDHDYVAGETVEATCTAKGYTPYECSMCHDTYEEEIPMLDHDYEAKETVESTCTVNGYTSYECSMCHDVREEELPLLDHDYKAKETVEATCSAKGYTLFECTMCHGTYKEETPMLEHNYLRSHTVYPTCTDKGYTVYKCSHCSTTKQEDEVDALGHTTDPDTAVPHATDKTHSCTCTRCHATVSEPCHFVENPATGVYYCDICGADAKSTVFRLSGKTRIQTSMAIADALKKELGVTRFDCVIVASSANFPDALTGSYLAAKKNAPILLTNNGVNADVVSYITMNMDFDGTVYILGGTGAVSQDFEDRLIELDINYKRLSGKTRYQTNLEILKEAGVDTSTEILICTGTGFADSLSASATGKPILLVGSKLTAEQEEFLKTTWGRFVIIGGSGVVSADVEAKLNQIATATVQRISGKTRYETSVKVAERFFPNPSEAVLAYAQNYPDGLCGGALAYALKAPLILTDVKTAPAEPYFAVRNVTGGYVLGGDILVKDAAVRTLFGLADNEPVPKMR